MKEALKHSLSEDVGAYRIALAALRINRRNFQETMQLIVDLWKLMPRGAETGTFDSKNTTRIQSNASRFVLAVSASVSRELSRSVLGAYDMRKCSSRSAAEKMCRIAFALLVSGAYCDFKV